MAMVKNRGTQRFLALVGIVIFTIFMSNTLSWISIGDGSEPIVVEEKGANLTVAQSKEMVNEWNIDRDYYEEYYIERTYVRGAFPFLSTVDDTIKTSIKSKLRD